MKIILTDTVGYYNDYKDNSKYDVKYSAKRINFRLNDDSLAKVYNSFEHNEEKLGIDLNNFPYESKDEKYLMTIVSDIMDSKTNIIPNENTKYNCKVILQIQSVYYNMENKDIKYYPQILLEQSAYKLFSNNMIIHPKLILQILNQILNQMSLKKRLMKILCVMNKNSALMF